MKKFPFEDNISLSIGSIEDMKTNACGMVKCKVAYKDENGKVHKGWSDWIKDYDYKIGDSIPIKTFSLPGTFGAGTVMLEVDDHLQKSVAPYIAAIALAGASALMIGYAIGKKSKK